MADSLRSRVIKTEYIKWSSALHVLQQEGFKEMPSDARQKLKTSLLENHFAQPFYVWQDPETNEIFCLDGRHRIELVAELKDEGVDVPELLPATFIECANKKEAAKLVTIYSSLYAKVTQQGLFDFLEMYELKYEDLKESIDLPGFDNLDFESIYMKKGDAPPIIPQSLTDRFIVPPFSVLDTRQGYWQDRKRDWHKIFDSQETREDIELIAKSGQSSAVYELRNKMRDALGREPEWDEIIAEAKKKKLHIYEGASIFDPVLAEICYKWFCPEGGSILDPFAGGSVRGVVAGVLGFGYYGVDLRVDQVIANEEQWSKLRFKHSLVRWAQGDSRDILNRWIESDINDRAGGIDPELFDFIFSCPPYHDLEQYSEDPADLSNMSYDDFLNAYREIIFKSLTLLKSNRFACFVVGDIRDEEGLYRDFVSETIRAFTQQPLCDGQPVHLYNELILINVAGSLPIRVGRQFANSRKVGKMHQNVLVFYKGDPKKIKEEFPAINILKDLELLNYQPNIALTVID